MLNPILDYNVINNVISTTDTSGVALAAGASCKEAFKLTTLDTLKRLLNAHKHQTGWTVLIAPAFLPTKHWFIQHGLATEQLLVIHAKQIHDLELTLLRAITSVSCSVIINCVPGKDRKQISRLKSFAAKHQSFYYQYEQLTSDALPH